MRKMPMMSMTPKKREGSRICWNKEPALISRINIRTVKPQYTMIKGLLSEILGGIKFCMPLIA
jgi:hypothetical protein